MHGPTAVLATALATVSMLTGCSQLAQQPQNDPSQARYVDATTLTSGSEYAGMHILTSVALQHLTAAAAEAAMQEHLPEGVHVGRTGKSTHLLIQGPGPKVAAAINILKKLDAE